MSCQFFPFLFNYRNSLRNPWDFSAQERTAILTRDGMHCQMPGCSCAEAWQLEVHHIVPVEHGGTHMLENGITLCRPCHTAIKGKELEYIMLFTTGCAM